MNIQRDFFGQSSDPVVDYQIKNITNCPVKFYRQTRDWTCSFACIKTILSSVDPNRNFDVDKLISDLNLIPNAFYSKDIKSLSILHNYDVVYGCDEENKNYEIEKLIDLLNKGFYIMVETMYNYGHWLVLIGIVSFEPYNDTSKAKVIMYDPYLDCIRTENCEEFVGMWVDGDWQTTNIEKDYIAIR